MCVSVYVHALCEAGGLVQSISQDGVFLLQAGQLGGGTVLQLILQALDLEQARNAIVNETARINATPRRFHGLRALKEPRKLYRTNPDLAVELLGLLRVFVVGSLHAGVQRADLLLASAQLRAQPSFHRSHLALLAV